MAEELQSLIDRIRKEALEKSEREAAAIITKASKRSAEMIREAQEKAEAIKTKAQDEADASAERGRRALEQAARDTLIRVERGVDEIVSRIVATAVDEALTADVVAKMLVKMAEAYASHSGKEARIKALISPQDQEQVLEFFKKRHGQLLSKGVEILVDPDLEKGFRISFEDGHLSHDFSREAISEALAVFLRPELARFVREATDSSGAQDEGDAS